MNNYRNPDPERLRQDGAYRREVFKMLVLDYLRDIYRYCAKIFGETEGEEIAQEVYVTAWQKLPTFKGDSDIRTWLFGIARNKCRQMNRNYARRRALTRKFQEYIGYLLHYEPGRSLEDIKVDQEQEGNIAKILARLEEVDLILVKLRYFEKRPIREIATLMNKSEAAIQRRFLRILKRLRKWMHDDLG